MSHHLIQEVNDALRCEMIDSKIARRMLVELRDEVLNLERAIAEHNAGCDSACHHRQGPMNCDAYLSRGRETCPDCPKEWKIEIAARQVVPSEPAVSDGIGQAATNAGPARSATPTAFGVRNSQGYWTGIYRTKEMAEHVVFKSLKSDGEVVVPLMEITEE